MVFTNGSRVGAILFGSVGVAGDASGAKSLEDAGIALLTAGAIGVILSTWLAGIPALRRR